MEKPNQRLVNVEFIEDMNTKLLENAHKRHWSEEAIEDLVLGLRAEFQELEEALKNFAHNPSEMMAEEVRLEAADVANYAMFIHSNHRSFPLVVESSEDDRYVKILYSNWKGEEKEYMIEPIRGYTGITAHHEKLREPRLFIEANKYPGGEKRDFLARDIFSIEGEDVPHCSDFGKVQRVFSIFSEKQGFKDGSKG